MTSTAEKTMAVPEANERRVRVRIRDLGLAPENLRFKEPADDGIPRLANTIRAADLIYPPIVRPGRGRREQRMEVDDDRLRGLKKPALVDTVTGKAAERRWVPEALLWTNPQPDEAEADVEQDAAATETISAEAACSLRALAPCGGSLSATSGHEEDVMDEAIGYFLELRMRLRRNPEARAVVDRCLALIAAARDAEPHRFLELEAEVERLRTDLVERFGEKVGAARH